MKTKTLLRQLFALFVLLLALQSAKTQVAWDTLPYKAYADFKLQNLNKSIITSGILYDRVFPVADIERFKQQDQFTDTTGPRHWVQAYYELYHSAYNNSGWLSPDALEARLDTNAYVKAIPIGILNFKYNIMDTNAYVDHLVDTLPNGQFIDVAGRPRSPYFNQSSFIASPLIEDEAVFVEGQDYSFYLDPRYFLYNDYIDIKQIRIDFGDGQGEWVVDNPFSGSNLPRTSSLFSSITKRIGRTLKGRIVVIGIDLAGHWIRYGNPFKILAKKKKEEYPLTPCKGGKGGGAKWVIDPDPAKLAPINAQYGNPPAVHNQLVRTGPGLFDFMVVPVKDTAYFFFKDDGNNCANKLVRRPVIFIDGFDPDNSRKVGDIYKDFINKGVNRNGNPNTLFGDYMLDNNFDFIILDFKHGNDLLERNAMALVALIERLNQTYGANYEQEITVIGPSMGSLIAQYALAYMERNNIPHRVRTYISFDGCHQGANVPIGLQNYIEYITKRGILKGVKSIREGLYNGLAAKQMLAHHHSSNSQFPAPDVLRAQFLQNLAAVGEYPQQCRKVALINGAGNGTLNPYHGTNTGLLDIEVKRKGWKSFWGLCNDNICKKIKWIARTATNRAPNKAAEMWTASPLYNVLFWVPLGKKNYYTQAAWGNSSQDNAPGGLIGNRFSDDMETHGTFLAKELIYLLTGDKPSFGININNFTMMPSYSAADIRYPNKNLYRRIDQCPPTPFDHIYAPTVNEEHVYVSEQGSVWFENEARGILPAPIRSPAPTVYRDYPTEDCNSMVLTATAPNATCYDWEVTGDLLINGSSTTLSCTSNSVTISSQTGAGGSVIVKAQTGNCNTLNSNLYFQPCIPWDNANFRWLYSVPLQGEPLQAAVDPFPEAIYYQWFINGQLVETTFGTLLSTYNWPCTSDGSGLTVFAVTMYGRTVGINGGNYSPICYGSMAYNVEIYPNPSSSEVHLSLKEPEGKLKENKKSSAQIQMIDLLEIKVVDKSGNLKKHLKYGKGNKKISFSIYDLPADIYYIEVSDGVNKAKIPLVVRK